MKIELLITGNELLDGSCVDRNTYSITRELHLLGLRVCQVHLVRDDLVTLEHCIQNIADRADLCIMTGGLGPTSDDLTLDLLAKVAQVELVHQEKVWQDICDKLSHKSSILPIQRRQARVPVGAVSVANQAGIAPGVVLTIDQCTFIAYPGVPKECQWLTHNHLVPWLKKRTQQAFHQKTLRFCWLSESELQSTIETLSLPENLQIAYQAMGKEHRVKLSSTDLDALDSATQSIKNALGASYLNDQDQALKVMVFEQCKQLGLTVALAESCTGGAVSAALTSLPGSSAVVIGGIVAYSNQVKQEQLNVAESILIEHGAVSEACAQAMAQGARQALRTDWGISITGIAGPGGGSIEKPVGTVCFAWSHADGVESERKQLTGDRHQIQHAACIYALLGLHRRVMTSDCASKSNV